MKSEISISVCHQSEKAFWHWYKPRYKLRFKIRNRSFYFRNKWVGFNLCLHFSIMSAFFELSPHFFNYARIFLIMSAFLKFMSIFFKLCLHFLNLFLHFLIWHFWATIFFDWQSSYRFTTYRKIQYKALIQFLTCVDFRQSLETRNACNAI